VIFVAIGFDQCEEERDGVSTAGDGCDYAVTGAEERAVKMQGWWRRCHRN
jgi:hypothetical protein